jgi:ribokinase
MSGTSPSIPAGPRVVVVGSLNVDLVVGLARMPAPGETVFGDTLQRHPGGKGLNQAVAAGRLGIPVTMVGAVGDDGSGDWLRAVMSAEGIDQSGISTVPGTSGTALIEVDATGANRIIVISGANDRVSAQVVEEYLTACPDLGVVLTQGEVPMEAIAAAMRTGRARGAQTILNPAPARDYPRDLMGAVDFLVPNEHEAALMTGLDVSTTVDAVEAAGEMTRWGAGCVVITRGERGAVWSTATNSGQVQAFRVHAVDTVAAGDAFCGGLGAALVRGEPLAEALRWASACGALAATKAGAVPSLPTLDDVQGLLA